MGNSSPLATRPPFRRWAHLALFTIALVSIVFFHSSAFISSALSQSSPQEIAHRSQILSECAYIHAKPGPPPNFHVRAQSDRYADSENTTPVLVRNATIWTAADNGHEVLTGDLLMHRGLIKAIGNVPLSLIRQVELNNTKLEVIDAHGAWVTPGIVDLHSHIGVGSAPQLNGMIICYSTLTIGSHLLQAHVTRTLARPPSCPGCAVSTG